MATTPAVVGELFGCSKAQLFHPVSLPSSSRTQVTLCRGGSGLDNRVHDALCYYVVLCRLSTSTWPYSLEVYTQRTPSHNWLYLTNPHDTFLTTHNVRLQIMYSPPSLIYTNTKWRGRGLNNTELGRKTKLVWSWLLSGDINGTS